MATLKSYSLFLITFLITVLLLGCSPSDQVDLPAQRPVGTITGSVVDGTIANAQVTVYGFSNNGRGTSLGHTTADENGDYSVDIQAADQFVLIEITGGNYSEQSTNTPVTLSDGQVLRAVSKYHSGQNQDVTVSPLSHIATGLMEYKIANGVDISQAYEESSRDVNNFFALNVSTNKPYDLTNTSNPASSLDDSTLYAFYLAGISNWSLWASRENDVTPHTTYTSIAFAQILYNDIQADGLLNGIGTNKEQTGPMPLAFGNVPLNEDIYRAIFSLHLLAFANSNKNTTTITSDDLLPAAQHIAQQTGLLLGASDPFDIASQSPTLSTQLTDGQARGGLFSFNIEIGGILGAKTLSLSIDNSPVATILDPPNKSLFVIDTTDYAEGEHTLLLTAVDALDNQSSLQKTVFFDNTAPVINITSAPTTNQSVAEIRGTFSDNIAGIQNINIAGQDATLFLDGTWSATVNLSLGENTLPIVVTDLAGNRLNSQTTVFLDVLAPVIDSNNRHSSARFSNRDGSFYLGDLQDDNTGLFLYLETDHADLAGVSINRQELNTNGIPFFAFAVSDQMDSTTPTDPANISVQIQYERNGQVLSPWHDISPVGGEYLVPLASETLAPEWHQSLPGDEHKILVHVQDPAGNLTTTEFIFYGDFYVPSIPVTAVNDLGTNIFANTDFSNRGSLNNFQFASNSYSLTNGTGKSFYLHLADLSQHTTSQTVEQLVRKHLIRLKTSTQWRLGLMRPNITNQCPDLDPALYPPDGWSYPNSVYNWTGAATGWREERPSPATYGSEESIFDDNLPAAPAASAWSDIPDFDQEFQTVTNSDSQQTLTYGYDYIVNRFSFSPSAGYVFGWTLQDLVANTTTQCDPKHYFQQRSVYAYESVAGYPKPVLSEIALSGLPTFSTTAFLVHDNDTGVDITPNNDWYLIPAGHSITIYKLVTTPQLTLYSDDISDVTNYSSYTPSWYDKSVSWQVQRNLELTLVHNAGEANIPSMPERMLTAGQNQVSYSISR